MAGAAFGEIHVSLFVAGAAFGEVHVSLFVAGAAFGEVHVPLLVAGAARGEIWNDTWSGKCCNFHYNLLLVARRVAVCVFMVGSCWERSRIGRALEMTFQLFSANFCQDVGWSFCVAGAVFGEVGG